jgi:hypothetical protein
MDVQREPSALCCIFVERRRLDPRLNLCIGLWQAKGLLVYPKGGGNPGTPAYVGMIGIILRRQKNTSRYLGITPLLVKLAYCLPPKKIWYDT